MEAEPPKAEPPKHKRRWFQFSLRTLLIFTMVVAVACGWLGKRMEQKRREQEAVVAIIKLGGGVRYDYQRLGGTPAERNAEPTGPLWLRNVLGENFFSEATSARLGGGQTDLTDADFANLRDLPELRTLNLSDSNITDAGLVHLKTLSQLKLLYAPGTAITGAGLGNLAGLTHLEDLNLAYSKVTNAGLAEIGGLTQLRSLELGGTNVTDACLVHLKRLTKLQNLGLQKTKVTDASVDDLQKSLPKCKIYH